MRECVKCGKSEVDLLIELKDRNCILCGATVETFVVCQPEPLQPCDVCGRLIDARADACPHCG